MTTYLAQSLLKYKPQVNKMSGIFHQGIFQTGTKFMKLTLFCNMYYSKMCEEKKYRFMVFIRIRSEIKFLPEVMCYNLPGVRFPFFILTDLST